MNTERFHNIEDIIGYTFRDLDLLVTALTHKSYANERKINKVESYERSEFLGDAILEFVVSEYLYQNYPEYPEGKLQSSEQVWYVNLPYPRYPRS